MANPATDSAAEQARWAMVDRAVRRGETLADIVTNERALPDEAEAMLDAEFADEDLRDIAFVAFRGRQP